ncbi:MAG: hypothetical protein FVQ77_10635 [Cytophagales bacterium]|nr:hypothetical protein [Cytophagales bacterium]
MSKVVERKLRDIGCDFISGYGFKSSDYTDNGIPLIKIEKSLPANAQKKMSNDLTLSFQQKIS